MAERMYYSNEAKQRAQAERTFVAILFTGLGISIGMALALLFAPMQGEDLREELAERVNQTRDNLEDYKNQATKSLSK